MQKYHWALDDAQALSGFLLPMLAYSPAQRATAHHCLRHVWLNDV